MDSQGTPRRGRRSAAETPLSPTSGSKSIGRRRAPRSASAVPLSSLPSNVESEVPPLETQDTAAGGPARSGAFTASLNAGEGSELPALENQDPAGGPAVSAMEVDGGAAPSATHDTPLPSLTPGGGEGLPATPGAGGLATPLSLPRPELGAPRVRAGGARPAPSYSSQDDADDPIVWGTTVRVSALRASMRRFYSHCAPRSGGDGDGGVSGVASGLPAEPLYARLLRQVVEDAQPALNIDAQDLLAFDQLLYRHTIQTPAEVMPMWDQVTEDRARAVAAELGMELTQYIQVRLFNLPPAQRHAIRDLDPGHIDTLVAVRGMVTRTSSIIPDLSAASFRCENCHSEVAVNPDGNVIKEPLSCGHCSKRHTMRLQPNTSAYLNRQIVKMQEDPSTVPEGETPRSLLLYAFDTNVDAVRPGDKVTVTGVFRASRMRINPRQRALHALFKTYVDVLHCDRGDSARLFATVDDGRAANGASQGAAGGASQDGGGVSQSEMSQADGIDPSLGEEGVGSLPSEEVGALLADGLLGGNLTTEELAAKEARYKAMAADPTIVTQLIASFAPNVIDMDGVKKGLLCQLFGGVSKRAAGRALVRGEINVLLVGDPSVSKSQLLGASHAAAPRGIYTSGKGSSAVGLTAYVTRDPETGEHVLESGALVLSDRGVCCIDEFDKMSEGARSMLHEVMEQQTVSVAKAGLVSTLNARTSILAGANPRESRYNRDCSIADNIALPPTLLSRFDLIYLCLDAHSENKDWALARHLVSLFQEDGPESLRPPLPLADLRGYIAYARARCHPRISPAAATELVARYKRMRLQGRQQQAVIVTPRQLEALIRISEALARMTLSPEVTPDHVAEANRLWLDAMSTSAADENGQVDMDVLTAGVSAETRRFLTEALPGIVRSILNGYFSRGSTTLSASELYSHYTGVLAEQEAQRAGGGGGAAGDARVKRVSKRQLMEALWQLPDLVDVRGDMIVRRGGGAAA